MKSYTKSNLKSGGINIRDEVKKMVKNTYDHRYSITSVFWGWRNKDPNLLWRDLWRDIIELNLVIGWLRRSRTKNDPSRFLRSNIAPLALDIGCGDGRIAIPAMWVGQRVVGIDISPYGLKYGLKYGYTAPKRAKELSRAQFLVADAENLPFRKKSFSSVYCIGTFESFINLTPTLKEVHRILDLKGEILFNFRNEGMVRTRDFFRRMIGKLLRRGQSSTPRTQKVQKSWKFQHHRLKDIKAVLQNCQFAIIRNYGYFVFLPKDIERLHHLFGTWVSIRTSKLLRLLNWILRWLDRVLGKSMLGTRLASFIAVEAHKSVKIG